MGRARRRWMQIAGLLGMAGLMGGVLWLLRGAERLPSEFQATAQEREIARVLTDFWVVLRDARGRELWRLLGKRVVIKKNGDYLIEGVTEGYYYRQGKPWIRIRAGRGEYRAATRDVVVTGQVVVEALGEQVRFEAERVEWRERERLLQCPQLGRLMYRGYVLRTKRILYYADRRELECPDAIRVEGGQDLLEAPGLRANLKEKVWRLLGPGRIVRWVAIGMALALLPRPAAGQPATPEQVQPAKKRIEIHYEKMVEWREESGTMEGNVVIVIPQDEVTVYAERVDYDRKKEIARVTGNLRLVDPENTLTGKVMLVYVKERRAVLDQQVRLVHTPKEAAGRAASQPAGGEEGRTVEKYKSEATILTCQRLEYFYRKPRKAIASGKVRMEQPRVNRVATADQAVYFEETDTLRLQGNVEAKDEEGQSFSGPQIEVGVEEEWVRAQGPGHFVIFVEEEEEEGEGATTEPTPPAVPPGPSQPPPEQPSGGEE